MNESREWDSKHIASSKKSDNDGENKSELEGEIKVKKVFCWFIFFNQGIIHIPSNSPKRCAIQGSPVYTKSCITITTISRTFSLLQKEMVK